MRILIALFASAAMLAACGRHMDANTVTSSSSVAKVVYGTVVSARSVTIKDTERLQDNALGGLAGGAAGGIAGSTIGGGSGRSLATVGGAVGGAVLGAMLQDQLSTQSGYEYVVKLDSTARTTDNRVTKKDYRISGKNSVADDINQSIDMAGTESDAIAVVQQDELMLAPGTRVMVVYSDDRPRVVPVR